MKKNNSAQGTIEYLVIIAIVVIIALVVVALLIGLFSPAESVGTGGQQIQQTTRSISLTESVVSPDGDFLLEITSLESQAITINRILIDGREQDYYSLHTLNVGTKRYFPIRNPAVICAQGSNVVVDIEIEYTLRNGLQRKTTIPNVTIPCSEYQITDDLVLAGTEEIIPPENGAEEGSVYFETTIGASGTEINAMAEGSTYVMGTFIQSSVDFPGTNGTITINKGSSQNNLFVGKLNQQGQFEWVTAASGVSGSINPRDIVVNNDNIFLAGDLVGGGTFSFNGDTMNNRSFVAKISKSGDWVTGFNIPNDRTVAGIEKYDNDDVFIVGTLLSGTDHRDDLFIGKTSGNLFDSGTSFSNSGNQNAAAVASSGGNLYIVGIMDITQATFGNVSIQSGVSGSGSQRIFALKASGGALGETEWGLATHSGATGLMASGMSATAISNERVFIAGITSDGFSKQIPQRDTVVGDYIVGAQKTGTSGGNWIYSENISSSSGILDRDNTGITSDNQNNVFILGGGSGYNKTLNDGTQLNTNELAAIQLNTNGNNGISTVKKFDEIQLESNPRNFSLMLPSDGQYYVAARIGSNTSVWKIHR